MLSSSCRRALVSAGLCGALLAGCTGDADDPAADLPDTDADVAVVGTDDLRWHPESEEAPAGEITVSLTCQGGVNHNFVIEEVGEVAECAPGDTVEGTIEVDPGEYTYVCTVPGHERTMRGDLTVE